MIAQVCWEDPGQLAVVGPRHSGQDGEHQPVLAAVPGSGEGGSPLQADDLPQCQPWSVFCTGSLPPNFGKIFSGGELGNVECFEWSIYLLKAWLYNFKVCLKLCWNDLYNQDIG